ncbi:MAG TPA: PKD domain-containing protein [Jatrophihabitantaceae bacterium]
MKSTHVKAALIAATGLALAIPSVARAAAPSADKTPPKVTAVTPVTGSTNVGVSAAPTATFSEAIQPSSVTATFATGTTAVPFTKSYDASTFTETLTPSSPLAYATKYTLTIKAKDVAGNQMTGAAPSWSFTTAAAPPPPPVDNPPVADLTASPTSGDSPVVVHLDASGSTDTDATPVASYSFDWGDGTGSSGEQVDPTADHTYTKVGTWPAVVTVKDTGGKTSTATMQITVTQPAPPPPVDNPPSAALSVSPQSGVAPLSVTADASASTDDNGIASYAFDFGDGSSVPAQGASTVQHSYPAAGTYTVTVTVTDTAGQSATASAPLTVSAPPPPPPPTTKPTSVVLTFDDGTVGQDQAAAVLAQYGLHGTFYINSGRVGVQDYLTVAQLQAIAAGGNEIAGHTVDHADLTTLSSDDVAREVCNDRVALHNLGFTVKDFAYPFGAYNASIEQIVASCGYDSARIIANLKSLPYGCANCITANPIPPADLYAIKTNTSVRSDTTLGILENYVTQAETDKGGLVPIVFHHIGSTGDSNEISLDEFTQFAQWLAARPTTTQVQTMDQVIGGTEQPYVAGPPLPTQNPNLVQNYSLEQATNGVPTGFQLGTSGVNTAAWAYSPDAHSGSHSERVDITAYTSGDRKLVMKQDASTISPQVTPGHTYTASLWAKGTGPVAIVTFYRDSTGAWKFWKQATTTSVASGWTQYSLTTAAVPAGATAVSFGLSLLGVGSLTTDDYSLLDNG